MASTRRSSRAAQTHHKPRRSRGSSDSAPTAAAAAPTQPDEPRSANPNRLLEQVTRQQLTAAAQSDHFFYDNLPGIFADPHHSPSAAATAALPRRGSQPVSPEYKHSSSKSRPSVFRTQSHDDESSSRRNSRSGMRLRTMTLESLARNQANPASWTRSRGRLDSINNLTCAGASNLCVEPSPRPAMPSTSSADSTFGPPLRPPASSAAHRQLLTQIENSNRREREASPGSKAKHDASIPTPWQMLHLMNLTRGKLEGQLTYQSAHSRTWRTAFCQIDADSGSLLSESIEDGGAGKIRVLVKDLRGCLSKASFDAEVRSPVIEVHLSDNTLLLKLRPKSKTMFNAWFAALLCWTPVEPGHHVCRLSKKPSLAPLGWLVDRDVEPRPKSREEAIIIKVGPVRAGTLTDGAGMDVEDRGLYTMAGPDDSARRHAQQPTSTSISFIKWSNISCQLRDNGELSLYTKRDNETMATIQLSQLSRCAVQRLHPSIMEADNCVAIYPQYARSISACSRLRPIYLSFDTRVLFEAWFVLLRAFTIPELFGPQRSKSTDSTHSPELLPGLNPELSPSLLRIERSICTKLSTARLRMPATDQSKSHPYHRPLHTYRDSRLTGIYFTEILLDGQKRGRSVPTPTNDQHKDPVWYETFDFDDLPSAVSQITLRIKEVEEHLTRTHSSGLRETAGADFSTSTADTEHHNVQSHSEVFHGEAIIDLADLEINRAHEKWWPLHNETGERVGDVLFSVRVEQDNILMEREYEPLSNLLHNFSNALTIRMAEKVSEEPARLCQILLDIFQATGKAQEWIAFLAEEEIDGTLHEKPEVRPRFQRRIDSNEDLSHAAGFKSEDRSITMRETMSTMTSEVSVLFRGNTVLTRSLDAHMKRLGKDYLEDTIGADIRRIGERDLECEIDPSKPFYNAANFPRLMEVMSRFTDGIFKSATKCPVELRIIFRHIRSFAVDKYGAFNRIVGYTSVSSFLFLRFFLSAVLHPRSYGIVNQQPAPRTQRTLTLLAKGLAALANLTTLGPKEPWMEPMNPFIKSNRPAFKSFIDEICGVDSDAFPTNRISPSYSTPLQIYSRLPPASREGFLSLPHLLDKGRGYAKLVNFWLDHYTPRPSANEANANAALDFELQRFHDMCLTIRRRTIDCYESADRRERRSSGLGQKWLEIAQRMEANPTDFWVKRVKTGGYPSGHRDASPRPAPTASGNNLPARYRKERPTVAILTPSKTATGDKQYDDTEVDFSASAEEGISRSASPMQYVSSRDSTDGEHGFATRSLGDIRLFAALPSSGKYDDGALRTSSRSKSKDRERDGKGWGLFRRRKEKEAEAKGDKYEKDRKREPAWI